MNHIAQAVRGYLDLGWSVIPLQPGTKTPPVGFEWAQFAVYRPEREEWRGWWQQWPGCNIAVVLGGCEVELGQQLVCVDTDSAEAEAWVAAQADLPDTPTAQTAKGLHRYYLAPGGLQHYGGKPGELPEIRAGGHYMVLPPSTHPSGAVYRWLDGLAPECVAVAELPAWGRELMRGGPEHQQAPATPQRAAQRRGYGQVALSREVGELTTALPGERNPRLNTAAFSLGQLVAGGELEEHEVREALLRACTANGLLGEDGKRACERTIDSGLTSGKRSPRHGNRPAPRPQASPMPAPQPPQDLGVPELPPDPLAAAEEHLAGAVNGLRVAQTPPQAPRHLSEIADEIIRGHEEYRSRPRVVTGLRTGFSRIDWHFLGLSHHRLVLVHGPSGYGKTTFARHALYATALASMIEGTGDSLGVYLLEGSARELLSSYLGWRGDVPRSMRSPGSSQHITAEWAAVIEACREEFRALPLRIEDREPYRDIGRLEASIRSLAEETTLAGIIVDHAQEIIVPGARTKHDAMGQVAERGRQVAEDLGIPLVMLSQTKLKDGEYVPEYSEVLRQKATLSFVVGRGQAGTKREQAVLSNITRVVNDKARCDEGPCQPQMLLGDWETGKLSEVDDGEEPEEQQPQDADEKREVFEWPNN